MDESKGFNAKDLPPNKKRKISFEEELKRHLNQPFHVENTLNLCCQTFINYYYNFVIENYHQNSDLELIDQYIDATELLFKNWHASCGGGAINIEIAATSKTALSLKVLDLIYELKREETLLVVKFLNLWKYISGCPMISMVCDYQILSIDWNAEKLSYLLLLVRKNIHQKDFYELWSKFLQCKDPVFDTRYHGKVDLLRAFLNSGIYNRFGKNTFLKEDITSLKDQQLTITKEIIHLFQKFRVTKDNHDCDLGVIFGVPVIMDNHVQCFRLMWDAFPDPYITPQEMQKTILEAGNEMLLKLYLNENSFADVCKRYEESNIFDDYREKCPRKLQHYSRCVIRKALNRNCNLPYGIENLEVSLCLKRYLKLE